MTPPRKLTEDEWNTQVYNYATLMRWMGHHCRPARKADGSWYTPISGDPGFPDWVFVRSGHVLFVELKNDTEKLDPNQLIWRDRLQAAGQDWRCWRPKDWPEVERTLKFAAHSSWRPAEDIAVKGPML